MLRSLYYQVKWLLFDRMNTFFYRQGLLPSRPSIGTQPRVPHIFASMFNFIMLRSQVRFIALAATLCLAPASLAQRAFTMFEQIYPIDGQAALDVSVSDADITVATGLEDEFHVEVQVLASDQERAQRHYDAQAYSVKLKGSTLEMSDDPNTGFRINKRRKPQVHLILTTPHLVDVRLNTSDGDIVVGEINGEVVLHTADGDIQAERLSGVIWDVTSSDDDTVVESTGFKDVSISTLGGDITVDYAQARQVSAVTSDGDIHFDHLYGVAQLRASDGDIHIGLLATSSVVMQSTGGDMVLDNVDGDVFLRTSKGNIYGERLSADTFESHSSSSGIVLESAESEDGLIWAPVGDITVDYAEADEVVAFSSDGDIHVGLLSTRSGRIETSDGDLKVRFIDGDIFVRTDDRGIYAKPTTPGMVAEAFFLRDGYLVNFCRVQQCSAPGVLLEHCVGPCSR